MLRSIWPILSPRPQYPIWAVAYASVPTLYRVADSLRVLDGRSTRSQFTAHGRQA